MDEAFIALFQFLELPGWTLAIIAAMAAAALMFFAGRLPPWSIPVITAIRGAALVLLVKFPRWLLRLPSPQAPDPLPPSGDDGRPARLPNAQIVTSDGTPAQMGRTDEEREADGAGGG